MRVYIGLKFNQPLKLPIQHNHILQAVVLKWLNDENYSNFIHNKGFEYNNRKYKMYTFSRLEGKFTLNREEKTITYYDEAKLIVSSADDEFLNYLINTVIKSDAIELGRNRVTVDTVKSLYREIGTGCRIITKSPITVYSTFEHEGKKKTYYYNPIESEFSELIRRNLIKKYIAFNDKEPVDTEFLIKPVKNSKLKENVIIYKNIVIKGWSGEFQIDGSKELTSIAYDAGLGSKNSQGFGCIEII